MNEQISMSDILSQVDISPTSEQTLLDYPPITCIANGESVLHEEGHVIRVMLYADLLCQMLESRGIEVNRHAVLSAIQIHDSHRREDYQDEEDHGMHAAIYALENGTFENESCESLILQLVWLHSVDDKIILGELGVDELPIEYKVIKDADALDRFRDEHHTPPEQGLDESFLRLEESKIILPIAQDLCSRYFESCPHEDPMEDTITIGVQMNIIRRDI